MTPSKSPWLKEAKYPRVQYTAPVALIASLSVGDSLLDFHGGTWTVKFVDSDCILFQVYDGIKPSHEVYFDNLGYGPYYWAYQVAKKTVRML
jgi:hypothetical protein